MLYCGHANIVVLRVPCTHLSHLPLFTNVPTSRCVLSHYIVAINCDLLAVDLDAKSSHTHSHSFAMSIKTYTTVSRHPGHLASAQLTFDPRQLPHGTSHVPYPLLRNL